MNYSEAQQAENVLKVIGVEVTLRRYLDQQKVKVAKIKAYRAPCVWELDREIGSPKSRFHSDGDVCLLSGERVGSLIPDVPPQGGVRPVGAYLLAVPKKSSSIPEFTAREAALAAAEGWNLFNVETCPEIQRDDEAGIFQTDEDAIAFVKASGTPHALRALAILAAFAPADKGVKAVLVPGVDPI